MQLTAKLAPRPERRERQTLRLGLRLRRLRLR